MYRKVRGFSLLFDETTIAGVRKQLDILFSILGQKLKLVCVFDFTKVSFLVMQLLILFLNLLFIHWELMKLILQKCWCEVPEVSTGEDFVSCPSFSLRLAGRQNRTKTKNASCPTGQDTRTACPVLSSDEHFLSCPASSLRGTTGQK